MLVEVQSSVHALALFKTCEYKNLIGAMLSPLVKGNRS